ncbi:helix-turn-helix transcriptional regulator [Paenibacillus spiritus]|uniref:Helix-turn-helix transcriptional regulator n=1 Tax=Paenibacillus spiritus TaxID=2496557 RepID=A0A5J5GEF2_9BACL|nr:helix-turn-helix domain-containing protein [Paenibacillus spiritus]KAA9006535.1 helix-turn-helix transcriptional regulator [Paenibacillus spiritus]
MDYKVIIDVSPVYELLDSFMLYVTRKWLSNLDIGPDWVRQVDDQIPPQKTAALMSAADWPIDDYDILYAWAYSSGPAANISRFLEELDSEEEAWWHARALEFVPSLTAQESGRIQRGYAPLLRIWHESYFRRVENQMLPLLIEDGNEKKLLQSKMDSVALVEYASGGVVIEEIPGLSTIVLLPTVHNRPINTYCQYRNLIMVQYPVDIPVDNDDDPPTELLRMTKALSDPVRLRLLRYLANEPKSLWEMKNDLGQSGDMLMHHLMMLRVAGLLRIHLSDPDGERFSIRPDGASELQLFLESYVHRQG